MQGAGVEFVGAPLSVLNMALTHPRDGTVVVQGQELNAEAILRGLGLEP